MAKKPLMEKYRIQVSSDQDPTSDIGEKIGTFYVDATSPQDALSRAHLKDGLYEVRCWEREHENYDLD